jgi:DNA processing protein
MAGIFAEAFAQAGICVVSGMAKGIDSAAHLGALGHQCGTIAIIGSGIDMPYPPENLGLYRRLAEEGLILSEYFLGEKPYPWHFPLRNRIISGLSRFVLLTEGEARSGALITCDWAAGQGKDVWALPGPVTNPDSIAPLQIIRDGAFIAITPDDILRTYLPGMYGNPLQATTDKGNASQARNDSGQISLFVSQKEALESLCADEREIFGHINYYPIHIDSLLNYYTSVNKSGKPDGNIYLHLTKLTSLRLIEKLPGDYYQRI